MTRDVCQIYVHHVSCVNRKVRVLRPFIALALMMMSLLCCLARYGLRYNHWNDVVVGFVAGLVLAIYIVSSSDRLTVHPSSIVWIETVTVNVCTPPHSFNGQFPVQTRLAGALRRSIL